MNATSNSLFVALATVLAASSATAQIGSCVVSTTYTPRSVHPAGNQIFCCMTQSGRQITVDATTITSPFPSALYDPPLSDQFGDGVYTRRFGGRLVAGYRWGDVNTVDTSIPTALNTIDTENTVYHHEGMELFEDAAGQVWVAYSEQNTSPGNAGGLRVYQMVASGMTEVGNFLNNDQGGNELEMSPDGRVIYQIGEIGGAGNPRFWVYDSDVANGFATPTRILDMPLPFATTRFSSSQMERNQQGNNLVIARGFEGLSVADTSIPTAPNFNLILQMPGVLFFDGVRFFPNSDICAVWGFVRSGGTDTPFLLFGYAGSPGSFITLFSIVYPRYINDIQMQGPRTYILGTDQSSGDCILDIW